MAASASRPATTAARRRGGRGVWSCFFPLFEVLVGFLVQDNTKRAAGDKTVSCGARCGVCGNKPPAARLRGVGPCAKVLRRSAHLKIAFTVAMPYALMSHACDSGLILPGPHAHNE